MATSILPEGWPRPKGYSNGMLAEGKLLAVAGQVAWDTNEKIVSDDFAEQFAQALRNVVAVVEAAGGRADQLISLTIFVTDKREYLAKLREIGGHYVEIVGRHYPAMALIEIAGLIEEGAKIEIQALAVL